MDSIKQQGESTEFLENYVEAMLDKMVNDRKMFDNADHADLFELCGKDIVTGTSEEASVMVPIRSTYSVSDDNKKIDVIYTLAKKGEGFFPLENQSSGANDKKSKSKKSKKSKNDKDDLLAGIDMEVNGGGTMEYGEDGWLVKSHGNMKLKVYYLNMSLDVSVEVQ